MIEFDTANEPISEECLADFEKRYGITLPEQYKHFLRQHNGGRPVLGEFIVPNWGDSIPNNFYGIGSGDIYNIERCISSFGDVIPAEMIPIADDPGGNQICIGVVGSARGRIYFWAHDDWDDDDNPSAPVEIAPSLDEFFRACEIRDGK